MVRLEANELRQYFGLILLCLLLYLPGLTTLPPVDRDEARLAQATRQGVKALGLELLSPDSPSSACTAIKIPEGIDGAKIPGLIRERYGVAIAGGQAHLKGKIVRISHMGYVTGYDILTGLAALEFTLRDLGHPVEIDASITAALSVLAS